MGRLRLVLALLVVDWILGTPGLGIETRTSSNDLVGWVYGVAFLALIAAIALTWRGKRFAGPIAAAVGALAVVLAAADIFGVTGGQAVPPAMVIVDVAGIVLGATIVWAARRVDPRVPLTA